MKNVIIFFIIQSFLVSCSNHQKSFRFIIQNDSEFDRKNEIVEIPLNKLKIELKDEYKIIAQNLETGKIYETQIGINSSGQEAAILFQPELAKGEVSTWVLRKANEDDSIISTKTSCYSRFVPERIDDYAWENDRVAFRTYGPEAQRLVDDGEKGGTKSSGIDCWFKKVDYPIINKWYKKAETGGSYHVDDGEGFDNYHVGISRGCGGIGIYNSKYKELYTSGNFKSWEKIQDGNLRLSFALNYGTWEANNTEVSEVKYISLDKGSNLTRYQIEIKGSDIISVGITLHDQKGTISMEPEQGWFNYWEPNGESMVATAIVANPEDILGYEELIVDDPDKSHILVHLRVKDNKVVYYSGFFWSKSNQFSSLEEWKKYLADFSNQISNPLTVRY